MKKRSLTHIVAGSSALLAFVVYLPALKNDFVNWDDYYYIHNNPFIRSFDLHFLWRTFFEFYESNWHPVTWISHALDYALWGLNPMGHHATSIFLHAANTYLVVLICVKLLQMWKDRVMPHEATPTALGGHGALIAAGITGILFGVHPIHVESVVWIAERKDVLCALFSILSVSAYADHVRGLNKCGIGRESPAFQPYGKAYARSLVLFAVALMSKPMAVSLPVVLLLLDWHPFFRVRSFRTFWSACREKLPFLVLSILSAVLTVLAQRDAMWEISPPWPIRLLAASKALVMYLYNMIFPVTLLPYYPYERDYSRYASFEYGMAVILVIGITAVAWRQAPRDKFWLTSWGYYLITLVPVLGIVQVGTQSMADRYAYLPSLAPFCVAGFGASYLWSRMNSPRKWARAYNVSALVATGIVVIALSYATIKQSALWKSSVVLWSYVIEKEPVRVPLAYYLRGLAFAEQGHYDVAIEDFTRAIVLNPASVDAYRSRGLALQKTGRFTRALADLTEAITLQPRDASLYGERGLMLKEAGEFERALADYSSAIGLAPADADLYNNRAVVLKHLSRMDEALSNFDAAITLRPSFALAYMNRGVVHALRGRAENAIEDFTRTISLQPDFVSAYLYRGELYGRAGRADLAQRDFQKACGLGDDGGCKKAGTQGIP